MEVSYSTSSLFNAFKAGVSVAEKVREDLKKKRPDLLILYGTVKYDYNEVFDGILSVFEDETIPLIGGTGYGIVSQEGCQDSTILLIGFLSNGMKFGVGFSEGVGENSYEAGINAALSALKSLEKAKPILGILHSDGFRGNGSAVLKGIDDILKGKTPITGGTTGDNLDFKEAYQFYNWSCYSNGVVLLLLAGTFEFNIDIIQGWKPIGSEGYLEKYEGNIVSTLKDGLTIQDFYRQILGKDIPKQHLGFYPLALYQKDNFDYILRAAMHILEDGSLKLAGDVPPETSFVRVSKANKMEVLRDVSEYMKKTTHFSKSPEIVFYFSCGARKAILGCDLAFELNYIREFISEDVPIAGFFTFAEFGPFKKNNDYGINLLHNQTLVLCSIWNA
ncbi:MAG: FIST C-terminal domain-containing protein [Candidatus Coatesbacteria bacterium]|nr:FIST C-terminal domain-containing protein [Candidatus Coatesbacteria bacterium]